MFVWKQSNIVCHSPEEGHLRYEKEVAQQLVFELREEVVVAVVDDEFGDQRCEHGDEKVAVVVVVVDRARNIDQKGRQSNQNRKGGELRVEIDEMGESDFQIEAVAALFVVVVVVEHFSVAHTFQVLYIQMLLGLRSN
jgi:hypothetical protein